MVKIAKEKVRTLRLITLLFFFIGLTGWFIPVFDLLNYAWLELPNSQPQGLYVDEQGYIYCGSNFYERIQMYDKHAKFIRAFDTDVGKGRGSHFTFEINNDQLHITVHGARLDIDRKLVYALDGDLLEKIDIESARYADYNVINEAYDSMGNHYIFKGFLWPRVIKTTDGNKMIMIRTPIYFWPFQAPLPAFPFFFISLWVLFFFQPRQTASSLQGNGSQVAL